MNAPTVQKPTVCRIVCYYGLSGHPDEADVPTIVALPGIVTRVNGDGTVDLQVFGELAAGPEGNIRREVKYGGDAPTASTWTWPLRA